MLTTRDPILEFADALCARAPIKLWSVVVTVLGDCARHGITEVSGPALTDLVERLSLQGDALRVSLHRLKRDGWVESRRVGRVSHYRLSPMGQELSGAVFDRIYAAALSPDPLWLVVASSGDENTLAEPLDGVDVFVLSRQAALLCGDPMDFHPDWLATGLDPETVPAWVCDLCGREAIIDEFEALQASIAMFADECFADSLLDQWAARIVVLHGWRRAILRCNRVAEIVLGSQAAPTRCRASVAAFLDNAPLPSGRDLADWTRR